MDESARGWELVVASPRGAPPGIASMVGYRALNVPEKIHWGMPSSSLTFIVSLDDGVQSGQTAEAVAAARPVPLVLAGLSLQASLVRQCHGQAGVQMAVHPLASRALFGVPSAELSTTDVDATAILGRPAARLREQLIDGRAWPERFSLTCDHLMRTRREGGGAVRPEVVQAWHMLARSKGRMEVQTLANRVGVTARHLNTLFRREVGRSPKSVARLMRFEHATARIAASVRRSGRVDLAQVAIHTGYCDQAHLSHEFVRFTGVSPRGWLAEEFRNIQDGGHGGWAEYDHDSCEPDGMVDSAS
jgi:AraC-like DNA-binding protein